MQLRAKIERVEGILESKEPDARPWIHIDAGDGYVIDTQVPESLFEFIEKAYGDKSELNEQQLDSA